MPVTKSASDALRKDRKRTKINEKSRVAFKEAIKNLRKEPTEENLKKTYSQIDRAAKNKIIHKNKASRLKSQVSRFLNQQLKTKSQPPKSLKKKAVKARAKKG